MKLNDILKKIILVGIFAVPFVPLIVSVDLLFPFISGKNFAFRIIVEVILAAWAVLAIRDSSYRPKKSIILWAFAIFVGILALADFFGENPYRSFWSNYERMEGLIAHLHLLAYFVVATSVLTTEKLWHRFFYTSFGVNTAIVFFSFFQLAGKLNINQGGVRVDATFGNATYLATYVLFSIFLLAFYLLRSRETGGVDADVDIRARLVIMGIGVGSIMAAYVAKAPSYVYFLVIVGILVGYYPFVMSLRHYGGRIFLGLLLLADIFVLYRTETRGDMLGLLCGVALSALLLAIFNREDKRVRNWSLGVIVGLVIFVGLFVAFKNSKFIKSNSTLARFASISLQEQSSSRFQVWDMSWQGFKERPILGWGQDNFIVVFSKYYAPKMWSQEPWFDRSHNVFFDWMIASGSLGILSYLGLFGTGLYVLWRSRKFSWTDKSVLTGLLAGYFFQNLFVFDNLTSYIMFFSVLGFVSVLGHDKGEEEMITQKSAQKGQKNNSGDDASADNATYIAGPVIFAALIGVLYYANAKPIMASNYLINGLSPQTEGVSKNIEYFNNLFGMNTFGSGEAREQLIELAIRLKGLNVPDADKQSFFSLAREQMSIQIERAPTDARYQLYLGSFLGGLGNYDEAIKYLLGALQLSPRKQQIMFELGAAYINKGEPEKGLGYFKTAYDEAPEYRDALLSYASGLIYAGKDKEAEALLATVYGTAVVLEERIAIAYNYRKMYDKVIAIREKQLEKDPSNGQTELSLADAYLRAGRRADSIAMLRKIIEQNPKFKEQGEAYIKQIQEGR